MRVSPLALLVSFALPAAVVAQPYGWFTGSTARGDSKTGDRVVIVDLSDGSLVTPEGGWDFADFSPGADPNVPAFTADGRFVYLLNGGDGNASQPTGHIYVFSTQTVINSQRARGTATPVQVVELPSTDEDAVEPVGLTIAPQGTRAYLTEAKDEQFYAWTINTNGTLSQIAKFSTGGSPSPVWLNSDASKGWFTVQPTEANPTTAQLKEVNLSGTPSVAKTVSLALPAGTNDSSLPFAFPGFPMPPGAPVTTVPPTVIPANDGLLYIHAGWTGFRVSSPLGTTYINDPVSIYGYNTTSGELSHGGQPIFTIQPEEDRVFFPPLVQAYESSAHGTYVQTCGSAMLHDAPQGANAAIDRLVMPNAASNNLVLAFGMLADFDSNFYVSSVAAADGIAFLSSQTYQAVRDTSVVYSYGLPGNDTGGDKALSEVVTINRPLAAVLGFAGNRVVVGASDTFFLVRFEGTNPAPTLRDSLCVLVDPTTRSTIEVDLDLVAGAYAEQPFEETSGDPVLMALLGTGPAQGNDVNSDNIVDSGDYVAGL